MRYRLGFVLALGLSLTACTLPFARYSYVPVATATSDASGSTKEAILSGDPQPLNPTMTDIRSTEPILPPTQDNSTPAITIAFSTSTTIPSPTPTASSTQTGTATRTPTPTLTRTTTPSYTPATTGSISPGTPTRTFTSSSTRTPTQTPTRTFTSSSTRTPTQTPTRTITSSSTRTPTQTPTRTFTSSSTRTPTQTSTPTPTASATYTRTQTSTLFTPTLTFTRTPTGTSTNTSTSTYTRTPTFTLQPTTPPPPTLTYTSTITSLPATSTFTRTPTTTATSTLASPTLPAPTATPTSLSTPVPPTATAAICNPVQNAGYESQVIALINNERANVGVAPLSGQSQLGNAARGHSQDMACNRFFSHTGSDGSTFADRITRAGYGYSAAAENIAAGYGDPASVVAAWMASQGHRDNMLNGNYTEVGIGYIYVAGSPYGVYWTANFGRP